MRFVIVALFAVATAAAASAANVDWDRYVLSDAIVRAKVLHAAFESTSVDVEVIFSGILPPGELQVWNEGALLAEGEEYIFFLRHESMRKTPPFFTVFDKQRARPDFEEVLREAVASMPRWSRCGSISVISYIGQTEIGIDPSLAKQEILITVGYRNETDRPIEVPGVMPLTLNPHQCHLHKVSHWVKPPAKRQEIEIPATDGTYRFEPVRVTIFPMRSSDVPP